MDRLNPMLWTQVGLTRRTQIQRGWTQSGLSGLSRRQSSMVTRNGLSPPLGLSKDARPTESKPFPDTEYRGADSVRFGWEVEGE